MTDALRRQWRLLQLIPAAPRQVTANDLWKRIQPDFGVTKRTVERDLVALAGDGEFPLVCNDKAEPYGWSWQPHARPLTIPGMSPQVALALQLVQKMAPETLPAAALGALEPYFETARMVLRAPDHRAWRAWSKKIRILSPSLPRVAPQVDRITLAIVHEALLTAQRLTAHYRAARTRATEPKRRILNPLGLVLRAPTHYLVCTIDSHTDVRYLAMHRLTRAKLLREPVTVPEGFDLEQYIRDQHFDLRRGRSISIELLLDPGAAINLIEAPLSRDQTALRERDGRVRLCATVEDTEHLRGWILGYGPRIEVVGPQELRTEITRLATEQAALYTSASSNALTASLAITRSRHA